MDGADMEIENSVWQGVKPEQRLAVIEQDIIALMQKCKDLEDTADQKESETRRRSDEMFLSLIDVMDSFERVFDNIRNKEELLEKQTKIWVRNFRTIYRSFKDILSKQGVTEIKMVDMWFDPRWHKAIDAVDDSPEPPGSILKIARKGYMIGNRCLRKAEVIIVREEV